MRILHVAMADSARKARWISEVACDAWDFHLFPVSAVAPHRALEFAFLASRSRMGSLEVEE